MEGKITEEGKGQSKHIRNPGPVIVLQTMPVKVSRLQRNGLKSH